MTDVENFSLLSDEEIGDLERVRRLIEDEEGKAAYRDGQLGRNRPPIPASPPLSIAMIAHLAYLDGIIAGIKALDTAASEQRTRRRHSVGVAVRQLREWKSTPLAEIDANKPLPPLSAELRAKLAVGIPEIAE